MSSWAQEIPFFLFPVIDGAAILQVGDPSPFGCHLPLTIHRKIGLAVDVSFNKPVINSLLGSGVARNDRCGLEILDDEPEDVFSVIDGISPNGFDDHREAILYLLKHWDGLMHFASVSREGYFPKGEFLLGIDHDVISVAPEVADPCLGG